MNETEKAVYETEAEKYANDENIKFILGRLENLEKKIIPQLRYQHLANVELGVMHAEWRAYVDINYPNLIFGRSWAYPIAYKHP